MARVKLTATRVDEFRCPPGKSQAFLWDSDVVGLGVRATPGGAKSYVFQSRFEGATLRMTIGSVETWPLANRTDRPGPGAVMLQQGARERARELQGLIDKGRDPRIVEAEQAAADVATRAARRAQSVTLGEAWSAYVEARRKAWGEAHYRDHLQVVHRGGEERKRSQAKTKPGVLASLLDEKLRDLTVESFEAWVARESHRLARVRLAYRQLTPFWAWCATHPDYRDCINPAAL